jgi:hypothetical protein
MKADNWAIKIERVLGGGDQYMANQEASALLAQSQRYDPKSQRIILRKWTSTVTRDPKMGEMLVPDDPMQATKGTIAAEDVFGTLMQGIPASIREGIERVPYIEAMIGMMGAKIQQITQIDNMGTPQEFIGLNTVGEHIAKNLEILSQDQTQQQSVKMFSDELGKQMNLVKAFGQRQQQAAEEKAAQSQINPEAQAKAQATTMMAQQKMQLSEASAMQKMQLKQAQFEADMTQRMERHQLEMSQEMERAQAQLVAEGVKTGSTIANDKAKTQAQIENQKKAAEAKPEPAVNN